MANAFRLAAACAALLFLAACDHMPKMSSDSASSLTGQLTKQLGVTETQAEGGVGSMLAMAKSKLGSSQFDQISKVIPGSDK